MKLENKDFWEKEVIINSQEKLKKASDFEIFMLEKAKERYEPKSINEIKIFGCGTGREIESIAEFYNPTKIVASDIAENMIEKCKINLKIWNLESITETIVGDAIEYNKIETAFDLVTMFNSMMTYIPVRKDRGIIFKNAFQIIRPNATLIGTVHNQVGSPAKTLYFGVRNLFSFLLGEKVGNRDTGSNGYELKAYYYTKKELYKDLDTAGFKQIEIYSLEEFYKMRGESYDRKKGYNNLIFIASKL